MEFLLRVLIVDDEPLVRGLLAEVIGRLGYEVATASDAAEARKLLGSFDPDIALLDVDLGAGPSGIDLAAAMHRINPALGILFLTNLPDPKLVGHGGGLPKGAGYLLKHNVNNTAALISSLRSVTRGQGAPKELGATHSLKQLSRTQLEVMRLVAQGKSNGEIALTRGTSVRAVRQTFARAAAAMGISEQGGPEKRVQAAISYIKVAGLPK